MSILLQNNIAVAPYSLVDVAPDSFAGASYHYEFPTTAVREQHEPLPARAELEQSYPNPFNPAARITFSIAAAGWTSLKVYSLLGEEVATLVDEYMAPGVYTATFDTRRANRVSVASGVYFYRLVTDRSMITRSMMFLK
jgi:hypothetical protein